MKPDQKQQSCKTSSCDFCPHLREVLIKEHIHDILPNVRVSLCVEDPEGVHLLEARRIDIKAN